MQCDAELGLSEEVKEDWEHFLLSHVILFETTHLYNLSHLVQMVVTEVVQEVVVVVAQHRRKETEHLFMGYGHGARQNRVADQRFPDVVIDQVEVLN